MFLAAYCWVAILQITLTRRTQMNLHQPLAVIFLTALISTFAMTSFAEDTAEKDTGQKIPSHVPDCVLAITNPDVPLYLSRSLQNQNIRIAKTPLGKYRPVDYKPGWYKIRAKGWIAWIQDDTAGVIKSSNCPGKT